MPPPPKDAIGTCGADDAIVACGTCATCGACGTCGALGSTGACGIFGACALGVLKSTTPKGVDGAFKGAALLVTVVPDIRVS